MNYDAVVIGAGAIACSIAYELASRKLKVCRVGRLNRANIASMAAGAMHGCFGEVTQGLISTPYGRLKLEMDYRAKQLWPQWAERLSQTSNHHAPLSTAKGTHVILNTAGKADVDSANYQAIERMLNQYGAPYSPTEPEDIAWLKPDDQVRPLRALYIADEHALNPAILLEKLDEALLALGGEIRDINASRVLSEGDSATGVELVSGEKLMANHVVAAAGIHSLDLLKQQAGIVKKIPPLFSGYGVSILVRLPDNMTAPESVIRTPNRAFACGLHCVPRGDNTLYLGATNILSERPKTQALVSDVQFLLDCATEQLHLELNHAEILSIQVGNRPIPADGFPLLGGCGLSGLWLATGTYRDGLHQSPLIAQHLADLITRQTTDSLDLSAFEPLRAPLGGQPRQSIVQETVRQMFATGYEYRWDIKPYWHPLLDKGLTENYQQLIDALHPTFTPPPELVAFSYLYPSMRNRLQEYYREWT
ncbi:formimidoyl fortimicin A synthetase [Chromobacterium amazonense]|uniref:Formimidoyl fortimicin A synthetase n=1 Tax=Chromobacterium amazonense TaxID=1382803 RepID=A0A2S9X1L2_9NEIS|nr:FAD-dependent oxidoreductase [Chromobacterium amazonense]PRP69611.1 formimidoyl fortimicin A synthetase [Chromobacterium amazonense]